LACAPDKEGRRASREGIAAFGCECAARGGGMKLTARPGVSVTERRGAGDRAVRGAGTERGTRGFAGPHVRREWGCALVEQARAVWARAGGREVTDRAVGEDALRELGCLLGRCGSGVREGRAGRQGRKKGERVGRPTALGWVSVSLFFLFPFLF
jgi:hypothetical protein